MHCGCPVLVSNRGSPPEIVGQAGIVLPPEGAAEWAEAMRLLLTDEAARARLKTAGLEQAAKFQWQTAAAQTLAIYQNLHVT